MSLSRRHFIKASAAASVALATPAIHAAKAGKRFRTALIGSGWWGKVITEMAMADGSVELDPAQVQQVFDLVRRASALESARRQGELDPAQLDEQLAESREELFNLRFQLATNQLDNTARIKDVKREVARIATVMREQELAAWQSQQEEA